MAQSGVFLLVWTSEQGGSPGPDWLAAIRAGEEEAARQFFRRYQPAVARIVKNRLSGRLSEDDLCQIIFLKVFSRLEQYSGQVPIEHWISRIAVNTCLGELKKEKHRRELREGDLGEDMAALCIKMADPTRVEPFAKEDAQELTGKLLDRLEPIDRLVVSLLYMDECSVAETSALTGLSQTVVKVRAFRARRKLNKIIQQIAPKFL